MTTKGGPTRSDTREVNVQISHPTNGNMIDYGTWDKRTGGQVDSEETTYKPGGMQPPVSLGGSRTVDNVVVSRLYRLARDHDVLQQIINSVGRSRMVVTEHMLDLEGNPYGRPIVWSGTLKRATPPDHDSTSNDPALIELEMTVEGYPTA